MHVIGDNISNDDRYVKFLESGFYIIEADWIVERIDGVEEYVHYKLAFRESSGGWIACTHVAGVSSVIDGISQPKIRPRAREEKVLLDLLKARVAEVFHKYVKAEV